MCGIAGILTFDKNIDIKNISIGLSETIKHRGPDDNGISFFDNNKFYCTKIERPLVSQNSNYLNYTNSSDIPADCYLALIHRRLSIIDLSEAAHQPMCDFSENIWVTYNGEIYNYREIRIELENLGYQFYTQSDTEVIINAYKHWGKQCVDKFNGMWAFAIYDKTQSILFLSRDRLGVKPLYYVLNNNLFAFASEQKAFIKNKIIPFSINYQAINDYLIHHLIENEEDSFFQSIKEVIPGSNLIFSLKTNSIRKESFFDVKTLLNNSSNNYTEEKIITKCREHILESVALHLRSDLPVGVCLSGGIDSSVIASAIKYLGQNDLHTFSIVFPKNKAIDESTYIYDVNKKIQATEHLYTPQPDLFFNELDELIYSQDIPIWSTSTYAQYKLMQNIKESGIKVVMDGQGSDELFGGYLHHHFAFWKELYHSGNYAQLIRHIYQSDKIIKHPFFSVIKYLVKEKFAYEEKQTLSLLNSNLFQDKFVHQQNKIANTLSEQLINDLGVRRLKSFLKCEDRCSMWHSIESRVPFSDDINLIQFAFSFNPDLKLKNGINKYVVREAFKPLLPSSVYNRYDKKGFETPLLTWIEPQHHYIIESINQYCADFINTNAIQNISSFNHLSNIQLKTIFKLFLLSRWIKIFQ